MRRPGPAPEMPPPLELECLKALWTLGEGNVNDVRELLARERALAYTTVLTLLDRLEKRGRVARRKQGRLFVYSPAVSREELRRVAVEALVEDFFDGSKGALAQYLGGRDVREGNLDVREGNLDVQETDLDVGRTPMDAALL